MKDMKIMKDRFLVLINLSFMAFTSLMNFM